MDSYITLQTKQNRVHYIEPGVCNNILFIIYRAGPEWTAS